MTFGKLAAAAAMAMLAASHAAAAPVTINPGENVFFNFDLTGAVPGPLYDEIRIQTNVSDLDGDELGHWNFYGEFGPPPGTFVGSGLLDAPVIVSSSPHVLDGIFSIQLVMLAGGGSSVTVDPFAIGVTIVGGQEVTTSSIPPVGRVPEPGTLALLGIALAGLGFRRLSPARL